jgi:hypothetical protein
MRWTYRFPTHTRFLIARWMGILLLILTALPGCVRRIEVHPVPSHSASNTIPRSLQVAISSLTIQGADHMPGITLLEWRTPDLARATMEYIRKRGTFASVSEGPADLAMKLTARLSMITRGPYVYHVRLQADMGTVTEPIKSYDVERSSTGSSVRWVTASDRDPIEAALQSALEDLLTNIETDRLLYLGKEPVRGGKP